MNKYLHLAGLLIILYGIWLLFWPSVEKGVEYFNSIGIAPEIVGIIIIAIGILVLKFKVHWI